MYKCTDVLKLSFYVYSFKPRFLNNHYKLGSTSLRLADLWPGQDGVIRSTRDKTCFMSVFFFFLQNKLIADETSHYCIRWCIKTYRRCKSIDMIERRTLRIQQCMHAFCRLCACVCVHVCNIKQAPASCPVVPLIFPPSSRFPEHAW